MMLADSVNTTADGQVNMLGQFDRVNCGAFPAVHPRMTLWLRMKLDPQDKGRVLNTELRFVDPDGGLIMSAEQAMQAPESASNWPPMRINAIIPMHGLVLPAAGDYAFTYEIDGQEMGRCELQVVHVPENFQPPPAQHL
jgi:hypothetical protein